MPRDGNPKTEGAKQQEGRDEGRDGEKRERGRVELRNCSLVTAAVKVRK